MRKKINKIIAKLLLLTTILSCTDLSAYANSNTTQIIDNNPMNHLQNGSDETTNLQIDSIHIYDDENVDVILNITSQWTEGYISEIIINNIGENELSEWKLTFDSSDEITNTWNTTMDKNEDKSKSKYSFFAPQGYNNIITPKNNISFGFNANGKIDLNDFHFSYSIVNDDKSKNNHDSDFQNEKINVEYNVTGSWPGGSSVVVRINNISNEVIHNWALRYITNDELFNVQCAEDISNGSVHIMRNVGWNQDIPVGSYVEFNFIQYYEQKMDTPDEFEILNVTEETDSEKYNVYLIEEFRYDDAGIVQLVIENKTEEMIEDWSLNFQSNFEIDNIWNAELISQDNCNIKIANPSYSQNIRPLDSIIIGMEVHGTDEEYKADSFKLTQEKTDLTKLSDQKKKTYIGTVTFSNIYFETGKAEDVVINGAIVNPDDCEVKVFKEKDNDWEYITSLYDNGNMNQNHDDIIDDGTYSNQLKIVSNEAGKVKYKVGLYKDDNELDSYIQEVEFYDLLNNDDLTNYSTDIEAVLDCINEYFNQNKYQYAKMDSMLDYIKNNCTIKLNISNIDWYDGNTLAIKFTNGLEHCIEVIDSADMTNMSRGSGTTHESKIDNTYEFAITKSSKILYWAPFDTTWGDSDETEDLKTIISDSDYSKRFTIISDENASVDSLKN